MRQILTAFEQYKNIDFNDFREFERAGILYSLIVLFLPVLYICKFEMIAGRQGALAFETCTILAMFTQIDIVLTLTFATFSAHRNSLSDKHMLQLRRKI